MRARRMMMRRVTRVCINGASFCKVILSWLSWCFSGPLWSISAWTTADLQLQHLDLRKFVFFGKLFFLNSRFFVFVVFRSTAMSETKLALCRFTFVFSGAFLSISCLCGGFLFGRVRLILHRLDLRKSVFLLRIRAKHLASAYASFRSITATSRMRSNEDNCMMYVSGE